MKDKIVSAWKSHYMAPLRKPIYNIYDIVRDASAEFFHDAPSRAFFQRAAIAVGGLVLFSVALALLPMGLTALNIVAMTVLQVFVNVFKGSLETAAKQFMPKEGLQISSFKDLKNFQVSDIERLHPHIVAVGVGVALVSTAVAISPIGIVVARQLMLPLARKGAAALIQFPLGLFKKKATRAIKNHNADEDAEATSEQREEIAGAVSTMSAAERKAVFERLERDFSQEFDNVAMDDTDEGKPAPVLSTETRPQAVSAPQP